MKHSDVNTNKSIFQKIRDRIAVILHESVNPNFWIWAFPVLLIIPNIILTFTEHNSLTARITDIILPLGVYLLLMSLSKHTARTILWFFPLCVLCAFQIVLIFLYGESIIAIDMYMNVLTTNASEVSELLGNLLPAIFTVVILYLPPLVTAGVMLYRHKFADAVALKECRQTGIMITAAGTFLLIFCCLACKDFNVRRELFPYNVIENIFTAVSRSAESSHYRQSSAGFTYDAVSSRHDSVPEIYVFVIGETARADNWSLFGYDRATTPRLGNRQGVVGFPRTLSEINTTHKSVPMLMSWLNAETFGENVSRSRSIFEAFNTSAYSTAFISNQRRNGSYIDFYGEEAQTSRFLTDFGSPLPDLDLITHVRHYIDTTANKKIFLVVHTYGSHFQYQKRYPRDMARFRPDKAAEAESSNRPQLINAYDNTIFYTDAVIDSLISVIDRPNTLASLIYVSDHGEDIYDDSRHRFLHASPVPTYWQLHVPMIVWTSRSYQDAYPEKIKALHRNSMADVSSSESVFHTLLDLAGISTQYYNASKSLSSTEYSAPERRYLNDYNESVPLARSGMRPEDFHQLRIHSISPD